MVDMEVLLRCRALSRHLHRVPAAVAGALSRWTERYPSYEHLFFDRSGAQAVLASFFPGAISELYERLTVKVQKADLLRVLLLSALGGIYADLDTAPSERALDELFDSHPQASALFFEESVLTAAEAAHVGVAHAIRRGRPELRQRVSNYFFAAAPGAAAMRRIIDAIQERCRENPSVSEDYDVLYTTGPDVVTECVYALKGWPTDDAGLQTTRDNPRGIETVVRNEGPTSQASDIVVVNRPFDQDFFAHNAKGAWKGRKYE